MFKFKFTPFLFSLFIASLLSVPLPVIAGAVRRISTSQAMGEGAIATIQVWPGSGVNISFIPTGEVIEKAWLDDPSHLTVDFDGPLPGATSIHLRRIKYINFPQLPSGNATLLTVIAQGAAGRHRYLFRLTYGRGQPDYYGVTIVPDHAAGRQGTIFWEQAVERGLAAVQAQGLISAQRGNSQLARRVQDFLTRLRQGQLPETAAQQAGISMALVNKLSEIGTTTTPHPETSLPFLNLKPLSFDSFPLVLPALNE